MLIFPVEKGRGNRICSVFDQQLQTWRERGKPVSRPVWKGEILPASSFLIATVSSLRHSGACSVKSLEWATQGI